MSITVTGVLNTPSNQLATDTNIRLISLDTEEVTYGVVTVYTTDATANYSFQLLNGYYSVEIKYSNEYIYIGEALVNSGTPNPATLPELVIYSPITDPEFLGDTNPSWDDEFNELESAPDNVIREDINQTYEEGYTSNTTWKSTYNSRLESGSAQQDNQVLGTTTSSKDQKYVFEDNENNEASLSNLDLIVTNASINNEQQNLKSGLTNHTQYVGKSLTTPNNVTTDSITINDSDSGLTVTYVNSDLSTDNSSNKTLTITDSDYSQNYLNSVNINTDSPYTSRSTETRLSTTRYTNDESVVLDLPYSEFTRESYVTNGTLSGSVGGSLRAYNTSNSNVVVESSKELTVGSKTSSEVFSIESGESKKELTADKFVISDGNEDLAIFDSVANTITFTGNVIFTPSQEADLNQPNYIYRDEYQYSPTNSVSVGADWHTEMVTGDKYRRHRLVTIDPTDNEYIQEGDWSVPALIAGIDGSEGDTIYFEYEYSLDGVIGWHETLQTTDKYRRERQIINNVAVGPGSSGNNYWSAPALVVGLDGNDGDINVIQYEYAATSSGTWHTNYSDGDYWRRERIQTTTSDNVVTYTDWTVYKLIPEKGDDYGDGLTGAGWYYIDTTYTAWPGDNVATAELTAHKGNNAPTQDDVLTYDNSTDEWSETRIYDSVGGTWTQATQLINGDLLVDGTIVGQKIVTGSLDANTINATSTLIVGSGVNTAGVNGNDSGDYENSGYRFWSGNELASSSNFNVTNTGDLSAANAHISGSVTATDGYFTGEVSASYISGGTIEGTAIYGSVIYGTTIYQSNNELLCDADNNSSTIEYYEGFSVADVGDADAVPVTCNEQLYDTLTIDKVNTLNDYTYITNLRAADDRKVPFSKYRNRYIRMANQIWLTITFTYVYSYCQNSTIKYRVPSNFILGIYGQSSTPISSFTSLTIVGTGTSGTNGFTSDGTYSLGNGFSGTLTTIANTKTSGSVCFSSGSGVAYTQHINYVRQLTIKGGDFNSYNNLRYLGFLLEEFASTNSQNVSPELTISINIDNRIDPYV